MEVTTKNTEPVRAPRERQTQASAEVGRMRAVERLGRNGPSLGLTARVAGALSLLAVGAVHLQQYDYLYSAIPTIGTLFLLNFVGATAMGYLVLNILYSKVLKRIAYVDVLCITTGFELRVLGGCCGTDHRHVGAMCRAWLDS